LERGNVATNRIGLAFKHQFNGGAVPRRGSTTYDLAPIQTAIMLGSPHGFTTTVADGSWPGAFDDIELMPAPVTPASDASQ
jgi:hypothetical protein